jgi:hypoxanthine phosphoribosyltransferase
MATAERLSWDQLVHLIDRLAEAVAGREIEPNTIVAVARGGFIPARLLSDRLGVRRLASIGVFYIDSARTTREIYSFPHPMGPTHRVLLVEDLLESGRSMFHAREALAQTGAQVWTATLFHRTDSVIEPDFSIGINDSQLVLPWEEPAVSGGSIPR